MSEHPLDVLRVAIKFAKQNRLPPHREDAALRAVEQLEQAARLVADVICGDPDYPGRAPMTITRGQKECVSKLGAALAPFDRKEQT